MSKHYHSIDFMKIPKTWNLENFEFGLNYKPLNTDKFLATYPRSGTTWVQHIMRLITNDGIPEMTGLEFAWNSCIEYNGKDFTKNDVIKTHLPFDLMPYNEFVKYLCVFRNPKDTCVSLYYYITALHSGIFDDFHHFFERWIGGNITYGDHFKHRLAFWSHRFDANFSFLIYEHMKSDPRDAILKIGRFLGEEYVVKLKENNELLLKKIMENSAFGSMRKTINSREFMMRKGIVGDWRSHFTEAESDLVDEKIRELWTGTGLEELWLNELKW